MAIRQLSDLGEFLPQILSNEKNKRLLNLVLGGIFMSGPFRFVYSIVWLAIILSTFGTLKECTMVMAGMAKTSIRRDVLSFSQLNRSFLSGH